MSTQENSHLEPEYCNDEKNIRRNNRRLKLEVSPQNGLQRERERERGVITELDNKATLQTSIKWDSTN